MMRIFTLIFILAVITVACGSNEPEGFVVKGKMENLSEGQIITLNLLTEKSIELFDSVIVNEDGEFQFNGNVSTKEFFMLKVNANNYVYLIIDSLDNITVNGNATDLLKTYSVDGSDDSKLLKELNLHNYNSRFRVDSLRKIFNSKKDVVSNVDSLKHVVDSLFQKVHNNERNYLISFIDKNKTSLAAFMALYQQIVPRTPIIDPRLPKDLDIFKKVDNSLMETYPNSQHAKALHAQVLEVKKMHDMQNMGSDHLNIGAEALEIAEVSPQGDTILLSSLRGQYVLLDFWASWCGPCRIENPTLVKNYEKYHNKGFEIYQVSLDKDRNKWLEAIKKDGLKWKHVSDLKFWQSYPAQLYKVQGIPASFLIGPEGKIIAKDLRGAALGAKLAEIFKDK